MSLRVIGTGSAFPDRVVTNDDLTKFMDTSDEWIGTRTGIRERRLLDGTSLTSAGASAARRAIGNAGIAPGEIDAVLCCTLQGDYISPSMSILICGELGIEPKHVLDLNMGCTGFLYSLDTAESLLLAGKAKKVLAICAESMSRFTDWKDRSTSVLFGDAAGAVVVDNEGEGFDVSMCIRPDPTHLYVPGFAGNCPIGEADPSKGCYIKMNGQEIYKFAVSVCIKGIEEMLETHGITTEDVSCFVLHQANLRIIESARKKLGQPQEKFPHNLDRFGNTSSATMPVLLDELNRAGRFKRGDKLILSAFGAGLAYGTALLVW